MLLIIIQLSECFIKLNLKRADKQHPGYVNRPAILTKLYTRIQGVNKERNSQRATEYTLTT